MKEGNKKKLRKKWQDKPEHFKKGKHALDPKPHREHVNKYPVTKLDDGIYQVHLEHPKAFDALFSLLGND